MSERTPESEDAREGHLLGCEKVFGVQWACIPACPVKQAEIAERDAWQNGLAVVEMTQREVDDLLEYSTTLPTGKTIGKRWKRHLYVGSKAGSWVLSEYVEDPDPGYVGIASRLIRVVTTPDEASDD